MKGILSAGLDWRDSTLHRLKKAHLKSIAEDDSVKARVFHIDEMTLSFLLHRITWHCSHALRGIITAVYTI